ncbi:hypothetical protein [Ralstonia phage Reminis]|uniref:Uncharacterized protein n=1 Tax=Ralstonia phage Reminis TaxID=2662139 RepID=A0A5Q2U7E0_9CAUD|nr:hypothetical protein [Ralstonia phage Reminis]
MHLLEVIMKIKEYQIYRAKSYASSVKKDTSLVDCYYHIKALSRLKPVIRQVESHKLVGNRVTFLSNEGKVYRMLFVLEYLFYRVSYYQTYRGLRKKFGSFNKDELVNVITGWK